MFARFCRMGVARANHYFKWAAALGDEVGPTVHPVPGRVYHLWHGHPESRRSTQRHEITAAFDFEPDVDIRLDDTGCWRWNSRKPEMHRQVSEYCQDRNEDGATGAPMCAQQRRIGQAR